MNLVALVRVTNDSRFSRGADKMVIVLKSTNGSAPVRWVPRFVALSAVWGGSFALIKVAVDAGVGPVWVALWRCSVGAVALWLMWSAKRPPILRDGRMWGHAAVVAVLWNVAPFTLLAFGETRVTSVLAGTWNATTPLTTLAFVLAFVRTERPAGRSLLGLLAGLAGVLIVLDVWRGVESAPLVGSLACLGAATCYGAGLAYTRRFLSGRVESAAVLSTAQVTCASVELALIAPLVGGVPVWPRPAALVSLLVLGALGTGVAYILNLTVIRAAGPTVASTVTYLIPVWSTLLGVVVLGESLSVSTVIGGLVVIGAVLLAGGGRRPPVATTDHDGADRVAAHGQIQPRSAQPVGDVVTDA